MEDVEKLNKILLNDTIEENMSMVLEVIPEIQYMIGFEHKHPHHHLDVWKHTLLVLDNLKGEDLDLKMAGLLHDIGKPFSYQDEEVRHFRGHPEVSEKIARNILTRLGYDRNFTEDVCYLVKFHDSVIDVNSLNNREEMIKKRLKLQYSDAKAHSPEKVKKRIDFLDEINRKLKEYYKENDNVRY